MNKTTIKIGFGLLALTISLPVMAGMTLGNPESETGALTLSGTLRANYQNKDYGEAASDQKIKFDAAILRLGYESPDWFGRLEYRCYQYDTLCDFSTLVYGYVGYRFNSTDNITLGLQPIPFGPSRFWDSSFYAGINNTMGLQDALDLGVNYHFELPSATKVDLAYFATDGGNYHGNSRDSARYTANVVHSDDPLKTDLNEKNMWMARVDQELKFLSTDDLKVSVGGSYWYSEIENKKTSEDGNRNSWALFNRINYKNLNVVLTGGKQSISNQDQINPHASTFGSFDGEYDIANKGYFYTVDTSYSFKNVRDSLNVTPYLVFSGFDKKEKGFDDSQRNIVGVAWDYKNVSLYTEYVMSKNDPFVGGTGSSLAEGDDGKWNKLLNLMLVYNF
ncbi:hypothetical protein [Acinetobacter vivianii]|uniref:hypothetical protein n=1 Tax=Acinetobacter vivianii TaxID=1776742 RepID=UPI002DB8165B|nr:hypothetical protein [Acinetobacter vivianii]MEB6478874.1 hypothetical protein [Acinetobacter vivianii]MEB6657294.1 hypothetical protein [Acinetobacter vivianii]